jgi:hypothetical protein
MYEYRYIHMRLLTTVCQFPTVLGMMDYPTNPTTLTCQKWRNSDFLILKISSLTHFWHFYSGKKPAPSQGYSLYHEYICAYVFINGFLQWMEQGKKYACEYAVLHIREKRAYSLISWESTFGSGTAAAYRSKTMWVKFEYLVHTFVCVNSLILMLIIST